MPRTVPGEAPHGACLSSPLAAHPARSRCAAGRPPPPRCGPRRCRRPSPRPSGPSAPGSCCPGRTCAGRGSREQVREGWPPAAGAGRAQARPYRRWGPTPWPRGRPSFSQATSGGGCPSASQSSRTSCPSRTLCSCGAPELRIRGATAAGAAVRPGPWQGQREGRAWAGCRGDTYPAQPP